VIKSSKTVITTLFSAPAVGLIVALSFGMG
jgi:hypothetical protein